VPQVQLPHTAAAVPLPLPLHAAKALLRQNPFAPLIVICGQLILQIAAWIFFDAVQSRGSIALLYPSALWVKTFTHSVTVICTLPSTGLAHCSTL
jgi:hypothetical protein